VDRDLVWEGTVRVTEPVSVERGVTLTIRPGTRVLLSGEDRDGDGCPDGALLVYGTLLVMGERDRPVRFGRLDAGRPWGEIFAAGARAVVRYAVVEGAQWGLHVHEGDVTVEHVLFRRNGGGARTRGTGARFARCTFRENGVGLRFWEGGPLVEASLFEENDTALFYRDGAGGARIRGCRIAGREWDLKVGDWAAGDLDAAGNHWGEGPDGARPARVGDFREEKRGTIRVAPALSGPPSPCGADLVEEEP